MPAASNPQDSVSSKNSDKSVCLLPEKTYSTILEENLRAEFTKAGIPFPLESIGMAVQGYYEYCRQNRRDP